MNKFFKNVKADKIPREITLFDSLVDDTVKLLQKANFPFSNIFAGVSVLFAVLTIIYLVLFKKRLNNKVKAT